MSYKNDLASDRYYPGVPDELQATVNSIINGIIALAARSGNRNMDSNLLRLFARLRIDKVSACLF